MLATCLFWVILNLGKVCHRVPDGTGFFLTLRFSKKYLVDKKKFNQSRLIV